MYSGIGLTPALAVVLSFVAASSLLSFFPLQNVRTETINIKIETLDFIHTNKTGALLEASVLSGALLTGASEEVLQRLSHYARHIGLAFQIIDDVLDITATQEELGKTAGKDLQAQKATYPSLWGIEKSKRQAQKLVDEAKAELAPFGERATPLMAIADFIIARTY